MKMAEEINLPVRLLRLLSAGGIRSTAELAQKLGVSDGLVTMMAEDLMRRGYLAALSGGDGCGTGGAGGRAACSGCSLSAACSVPTARDRLPLLALTPRGRQMAAG